MSKRSAQGPQGSKDSDLLQFNMSSTPDDKPQRATAAQLASRRIKEIRRRPRPGASASGTASASSGGPFSSIDPNTVSSPSASTQPMTNGFTFGQSQSFPGAGSDAKPPAQNGGPQFAFGSGGGGSSAFNFSSSFTGAGTSTSNPFASLNTTAPSQPSNGASFAGFKGNMFNIPPSSSQSPAQQPLPSGGLFGAGSQENGSTGGLFSSTTTSAPANSGTTTPSNGTVFGQSTTNAPSMNIFGQSGADKPTPFAQSTAFSSDSMQTSPDAKASAPKQSIFGGSSSGGFGVSTNFGSSGAGNLFGATTSAPAQTPSKPLFGAKATDQPAPATTSLFAATTQPTSSSAPALFSSPAPATAPTTTTTSSSLFGNTSTKPTAAAQNPFQSANLFGAPTSSTTEKAAGEKAKEETKTDAPTQPQGGFQFSSATNSTPLFSQSGSAASSKPSSLFQPASTGSIFAPAQTAPASIEQEQPKPIGSNPFSSLFVHKPASSDSPKMEQKPLPSSSSFGNLFSSKPSTPSEAPKPDESVKSAKPTASTSLFPVSSPAKASTAAAPQSPAFSISTPQANPPTSGFSPAPTSQSLFKVNDAKPTTPASPALPTGPSLGTPTQSFDQIQPAKTPSGLDKNTKDDVEKLYRVRLLNECFRREVNKLDPTSESFDAILQFYMRVRETIGAPIEGVNAKRKASDNEDAVDTQPSKKLKPFGTGEGITANASSKTTNGTQSQLFGNGQATPATNKRKANDDGDDTPSTSEPSKRVNGDSTTASIFASSFSRSKTSDSSDEASSAEPSKKPSTPLFKPSTPEPTKPSLFSTTPTSSPPKPLFSAPTPAKQTDSTSGSNTTQPPSIFKPTFSAPTSGASPSNPFVLKPSGDASASASRTSISIPKFGSGNTNFFAQFKAQSDKEAEKEKEKRKAEDFDSDEDDEAEWERKDAENQRKKREEIEAQMNRRAKFVPGQGFSFDEETDTADGTKATDSPASSIASASVFDTKPNTLVKSSNIFGHLSATPSETDENENDEAADDTEEASASGDDAAKDLSFAPTSEDEESQDSAATSKADSKATLGSVADSSAQESSDEGDLTEALKKSKQAPGSDKPIAQEQAPAEQGSSGRSLFDRVEYDQDGNPKRQGEGDKSLSTFFTSSKFASSFNSPAPTPNPFTPSSQSPADKADETSLPKPTSTNIFGSTSATGSIFGTAALNTSGTSTPSVFGTSSSTTKPGADHTWKINTPIKFAPDSTTGTASTSKPEASDPAKPFSALFGAPSTGPKSASGSVQPTLGFSFGGPSSQPSSSFLTPSVLNSGTPSRASTPGITSDTGAEESGDGETAESLPQVDLARSGAGEENEDVVIETRARGMKLNAGAWESQGVGYLRVLKDRTTSRGRILLRADPSGKVILNTSLMKEIKYTVQGTSVQFLVPKSDGPPEQWAVRVKKEDAERLGSAIEETKS